MLGGGRVTLGGQRLLLVHLCHLLCVSRFLGSFVVADAYEARESERDTLCRVELIKRVHEKRQSRQQQR